MRTTWITIALYDDWQAATSLENFLKARKVDTRTFNDKLLQLLLFLCPPHAVFRVQVRHPFHKMALDILNTTPPGALLSAIHCPACGSLRVNYPQMTRKFVLPTILLHFAIIFRITKHQAYCETCHHLWPLAKGHYAVDAEPVHHSS